MLILDSNLWIHALTIGRGYPDECVDRFLNQTESSAVNAYIYREVVENIDTDTSVPKDVRNDTIQRFCALVDKCPAIESCSQASISEMNLDNEREAAYNNLIGALVDIQAKDAPVFTLAFKNRERQPTISTNDKSFAAFTPAEYGLAEISITYVDVEWERIEHPAE